MKLAPRSPLKFSLRPAFFRRTQRSRGYPGALTLRGSARTAHAFLWSVRGCNSFQLPFKQFFSIIPPLRLSRVYGSLSIPAWSETNQYRERSECSEKQRLADGPLRVVQAPVRSTVRTRPSAHSKMRRVRQLQPSGVLCMRSVVGFRA